ncbi:MAG: phosphoenolpyruvate-protein phosphotransferase system enzyme [Solirubrobacteraceae bacterium]|jgi:phosphoenolpyruvate-protein phosphotransferase|nr:phosphoenolpyruvate-protein phosphotransferase system enzyme [Solirubrobacteraceae bacterium]
MERNASPTTVRGRPASPGVAVGRVVRWEHAPSPARPRRIAGDAVPAECRRLRAASDALGAELTRRALHAGHAVEGAIVRAHAGLARDATLLDAACARVREHREDAATAVLSAADALAADLAGQPVERLRERAIDVRDVAARLAAALRGEPSRPPARALPDGAVLVAAELTPSDAVALDHARLRAIVLGAGGPTSHTAILARTYGIPAVGQAGSAIDALAEGATVVVDGDTGIIELDPSAERVANVERRVREASAAAPAPALPARTRDGRAIALGANVGSAAQARRAAAAGATEIGLFRTELLFFGRPDLPDEDEQAAAYGATVEAMAGRRVVFRTLDVGGDKPLPALGLAPEPNPMLGRRGVRLWHSHAEVLDTQLRALLRAAAAGPVTVMIPMVSCIAEVDAVVERLRDRRRELQAAGVATGDVAIAAMIETPAAVLLAAELARRCDLLSIGTNDLLQYLVAADRDNAAVAALLDPCHPALLRAVDAVVDAGRRHGTRVAVCGEAAADPVVQRALVGLGVDELSMVSSELDGTRDRLGSVTFAELERQARSALAAPDAAAARCALQGLAATEGAEGLDPERLEDGGLAVELVLAHPEGLHARPADAVVRRAAALDAAVTIVHDGARADASSMLAVLALGADTGARLRLEARGPDAGVALRELAALLTASDPEG